jgi:4'-phosphopantetheinyl transferase
MFQFEEIVAEDVKIVFLWYKNYTMDDYLFLLNETESERYHSFSSTKRKYEFLSTRILKEHFFPNTTILYTKDGAPFIKGIPHISISHSKNFSAIAYSSTHVLGLDIEPISSKALRLSSKFLNDNEIALLDVNDELTMVRAWSCKEALLKLTRRKGIIFKRDLLINDFNDQQLFSCTFSKDNKWYHVDLLSIVKEDMVITINKNNPILTTL